MKAKLSGIMDKYPHEIFKNNVGKLEVIICGVDWAVKSFQKYEEFYDELISNSICVVHEFSPDKSYSYLPSTIKKSFPRHEPYTYELNEGMRNLCEEHKKRIFKVDPLTYDGFMVDVGIFVGASAGFGLLSGDIVGTYIKENKFGRKEFLEGTVSLILACLLISTHKITDLVSTLENKNDKFLRMFTYGYNDFRNVKIAKGLEIIPEMLEKNDKGDYMLVFEGWNHTRAIDYYLTHSMIRQAKEILYSVNYDLLSDKFVRMHDVKEGLWKDIRRRPY